MADTKISGLTALTGANTASGDLLTIVDISDTTMAATGTNKKITLTELQGAPVSAGTANGVLYLNGSKVATSGSALVFDGTNLGIGTSSPSTKLDISNGSLGTATLRGAFAYAGDNYNLRLINDGSTYGYLAQVPAAGGIVVADGMRYYGAGNWIPDGTSASSISQIGGVISFTTNSGLTAGTNFAATEQMRLTSTGLGIGTSSPAVKLQVYNNINGTPFAWGNATRTGYLYQDQNGVGITNASGTSFDEGVYLDTANSKVILYTNSTDRVTLDSSGNLGLGVTPSDWNSGGKINLSSNQVLGSVGDGIVVSSNWYYNAGSKFAGTGYATYYQQTSGSHLWLISTSSGTIGNTATMTQAMTLDASGNLGIGVTSVASKLHVKVTGGSDDTLFSYGANQDNFITAGSSGVTIFRNLGTERARIDSSGNLIQKGATTAANIKPSALGNSEFITTANSATYTVTLGTSAKLFWISLGNGDAALVFTSYLSSSITFIGITPNNIVASASPTSAQLGISKSANSHDIVIKTGSALSSTAASWQMGVLSSGVS